MVIKGDARSSDYGSHVTGFAANEIELNYRNEETLLFTTYPG